MMLQKIAGSSQTIRAPKGLLRAGAPSPRRQMTSKMAPAQQSSSLLFLSLFFSPPTDFCFSHPPFFPSSFCFKTSCRATFWRWSFLGGLESLSCEALGSYSFIFCLCVYWFHKATQILTSSRPCVYFLCHDFRFGNYRNLVEYCVVARSCKIFTISYIFSLKLDLVVLKSEGTRAQCS